LLEGCVEAGELELMTPFELQAYRCHASGERLGRADGGRGNKEKDGGHGRGQSRPRQHQTGLCWSAKSFAHADHSFPGRRIGNIDDRLSLRHVSDGAWSETIVRQYLSARTRSDL